MPGRPRLITGVKGPGITGGGGSYLSGTVAPAVCSVGDVFLKTDAAAGENLYFCGPGQAWTPLGDPGASAATGRPYLQDWQGRLGALASNTANTQATVVWLGDSWTSQNHITDPLRRSLQDAFGDAGIGYVAFDSQTAAPAGAVVASAGSWTDTTLSATPGVNGNSTKSTDSSTPAAKSVTAAATGFVLHYVLQPGGGQFRYRVDAGAWTTVDTAAIAERFGSATVSGLAQGSHTLTAEVVSGGANGVTLLGADCQKSESGVRVHRIGHPGAAAENFTNLDAGLWQSALAEMKPNVVALMFGTNEAILGKTPESQKAALRTVISRIKLAAPRADVMIVSPSDNGQPGTAYRMAQYAAAQRELAREQGAGFVDAFKAMGAYADANARGLYANATHVNAAGGAAIAAQVEAYLTGGLAVRAGGSVAAGANALRGNTGGTDNVALGRETQRGAGPVSGTVAVGAYALSANTGSGNTAVGFQGLRLNSTGSNGTAVGYRALAGNTAGQNNTAVGWYAMGAGSSGHNNAALGYNALNLNAGANNTGVGTNALAAVTSGASNTALGRGAGALVTTGGNNTFVGSNAGLGSSGQRSYLTVIGAEASGDEDDAIVLGRASDKVRVASGRLQFGSGVEPVCDAASRGMVVFVAGGSGVKDTVRVCAKDVGDLYGWRLLY
jgi:lysophospholipase L1-like esterase